MGTITRWVSKGEDPGPGGVKITVVCPNGLHTASAPALRDDDVVEFRFTHVDNGVCETEVTLERGR